MNPLPLALIFTTAFGVLMHDTQLDQAAATALAPPVMLATYAAADVASKSGGDHTHVEKVSVHSQLGALRANVPRIQPRDDDRRYIQTKKVIYSGGDANSFWPSV